MALFDDDKRHRIDKFVGKSGDICEQAVEGGRSVFMEIVRFFHIFRRIAVTDVDF